MPHPTTDGPQVSGAGRPRDPARHTAIQDAIIALLGEVGYDRLTIEAVAARSGVAKTTIYRRWPGKASMVAAAVEARASLLSAPLPSAGGALRDTVVDVIAWLAHQMSSQDVGMLNAVFVARRTDPELATAMDSLLRRDQTAMFAPIRRAAIDGGVALHSDADSVMAELVPALLLHHILVLGGAPDAAWTRHIADRMVLPLITRG